MAKFKHTAAIEDSLKRRFGKHIRVIELEPVGGKVMLTMNDFEAYMSRRGKARLRVLRMKYGLFIMTYSVDYWIDKYENGYTKPAPRERKRRRK